MEQIMDKFLQALEEFAAVEDHGHHLDPVAVEMHPMDFAVEFPASFPVERFKETRRSGVLYRPDIVEKMEELLMNENQVKGLFVRGPQGIGKSHSMVNLVRRLRARGAIVTFIPTCEDWCDNFDLLQAMCRSIKSSTQAIGIDRAMATTDTLLTIIDRIEAILPTIDKDWFFLFDQINRIFARPQFSTAKDVGVLPPPFNLMKLLNLRNRMKCVVSASANNSTAYKENHPGFCVYDHPLSLTVEEMLVWKPHFDNGEELFRLKKVTGLCPLQVAEYLESPASYEPECIRDVRVGVGQLLAEHSADKVAIQSIKLQSIKLAAVYCLLSIPPELSSVLHYDRKYSAWRDGLIVPLFPAVLVAYRIIFWNDLIQFVEKNEIVLLNVCANVNVSNDVRERLFELIVIVRFRKNSVLSKDPKRDVLPASVDSGLVFETQELPTAPMMAENTLFIPKNSNFPAIDLILKSQDGEDVWAVKVHVADHDDVLPTLRRMCDNSGWFQSFDNIYLVYLSPSDAVMNMLTCIPRPPQRRSKRPRSQPPNPIHVSAATIRDFECLRDIQWTAPLMDETGETLGDDMVT